MRRTVLVLVLVMLCAVNAASGMLRSAGPAEIRLGQTVTGETPGAYYKIALYESNSYVVRMLSVPEEMITSIKVGDYSGSLVAETETSSPGEIAQLRFDTTEPGTYNVEISELEGKECGT